MLTSVSIYSLCVVGAMVIHSAHALSDSVEQDLDEPLSVDGPSMRDVYTVVSAPEEKRPSLFRFGKRSSLLRFGKRSSLLRFGKRPDFTDDELVVANPSTVYDLPEDSALLMSDKRGSLFRFGKKSRNTADTIKRSEKEKKPHTPWRFGRYLNDGELPWDQEW